jgi:hypothetical protein
MAQFASRDLGKPHNQNIKSPEIDPNSEPVELKQEFLLGTQGCAVLNMNVVTCNKYTNVLQTFN